jgi:predicted O-methyltransferase YrrM
MKMLAMREGQAADSVLPSVLPNLDFRPSADAEALLASLPGSELLARTVDFFDAHPPASLLGRTSRSLLYLLCRQLRPRVALEVGAFFAGAAELLARALAANGHGELITVDPYGGERAPPALETWPEELRSRVISLECNSMQCFMLAEQRNVQFDLAFIDGDHSYEYALFDLGMVARQASPGAIVVMDNCEQPGVFLAARRFLEDNPGWRELGDAIYSYREASPFEGLRPSYPDSSFLILQAPAGVCLSAAAPTAFQTGSLAEPGLRGVEFAIDPRHGGGALHLMTFFRSFHHDLSVGQPEQKLDVARIDLAPGQGEARLAYAEPFLTAFDPTQSFRKFEFILAWTPRVRSEPLRLLQPPMAIAPG